MIDLTPFTGNSVIARDDWFNAPFNVGDETIALNGHILIAVPKRDGYLESEEGAKQVAKLLERFPSEFRDLPVATPWAVKNGKVLMKFDDSKLVLDQKYLNLISGLPGIKVATQSCYGIEDAMLYWKSDESRGVLMGCRT